MLFRSASSAISAPAAFPFASLFYCECYEAPKVFSTTPGSRL